MIKLMFPCLEKDGYTLTNSNIVQLIKILDLLGYVTLLPLSRSIIFIGDLCLR